MPEVEASGERTATQEEVFRHVGEWVQAGEPVLHIIRVNRLRVEGFISASKYEAGEIHGRDVDVSVKLARGRQETFKGKIVFVDPRVQASNEFLVWAELIHRRMTMPNYVCLVTFTHEGLKNLNVQAVPGMRPAV